MHQQGGTPTYNMFQDSQVVYAQPSVHELLSSHLSGYDACAVLYQGYAATVFLVSK